MFKVLGLNNYGQSPTSQPAAPATEYEIYLMWGDDEPADAPGSALINNTHMSIGFAINGVLQRDDSFSFGLRSEGGEAPFPIGHTWLDFGIPVPHGTYPFGIVYVTDGFKKKILATKVCSLSVWNADLTQIKGMVNDEDAYSLLWFNCDLFCVEEWAIFSSPPKAP
jgi:hypothetical protein